MEFDKSLFKKKLREVLTFDSSHTQLRDFLFMFQNVWITHFKKLGF